MNREALVVEESNILAYKHTIAQQAAQIDLLKRALLKCKFDSLNMTLDDWKFVQQAFTTTPDQALKQVLGEPVAWIHTVGSEGKKAIGYTEVTLALPVDTDLYALN